MAEHVQSEVDMVAVVRNIYAACDPDSRNAVRVSMLIEFIKPFMGENMSDLMELKKALDPNDDDLEISSEHFYKIMAEWTEKFRDHSTSFHNISVEQLGVVEEKALPFVQSTPRASFGNKLKKGNLNVGILNASLLSNQSLHSNTTGPTGHEKSYYEDQINELTHQNKKYSDELLHIKLQLVNAEEQNDALQAELDKLKEQLVHEREVIETLQNDQRDFEELRETATNAQKQADRAEKRMQTLDKENNLLKLEIDKLEEEKQRNEEKINNMHKKVCEKVTMIIELETEMKVKDQELANLEELNNNLMQRLDEDKKIIDDYQESTRCMQVEKEKLQKILKERMKKPNKMPKPAQQFSEYKRMSLPANTLPLRTPPQLPKKPPQTTEPDNDVPFVSAIKTEAFNFFNYESPYARMKRRNTTPLSPLAKPHNNNTHTPVITKTDYSTITKTILDVSLPSDMNVSPLEPVRVCRDLVPRDYFKSPIKGDDSFESPPCMYAVRRSTSPYRASPILTSPNVSTFSINDSSDDEITRIQLASAGNYSPRDSLKSEILKAIAIKDEDEDDESAGKSEYENRISHLEFELKQRQLDYDRLEFDKLKLENDVHTTKIKQLETDNNNIQKQVEEFKSRLEELQCENDTISRENAKLLEEFSNEKNELESLRRGKESCEKRVEAIEKEKAELEELLRGLQVEKSDLEELLNRARDARNELENRLNAAQSQNDELASCVKVTRTEKEEISRRLNAARNEKLELEKRFKEVQEEKDEFAKRLSATQFEKDEFSRSCNGIRNEKDELAGALKSARDKIAALETRLNTIQNERKELKSLLEIKSEEYEEIKSRNTILIKQNSDLIDEKSCLNKENARLRKEFEILSNERETLSNTLGKQIEVLNLKEANFEEETCGLQRQVEGIRAAYDELKTDLERIKSNNLEEIKVLQKNIAELIDERESLENDRDAREKKLSEYEKENIYLKDKIDNLEIDLRDKIDLVRNIEGQLREKEAVFRTFSEFSYESAKQQKDKENAFINGENTLRQRIEELEEKVRLLVDEKSALEANNVVILQKLKEAENLKRDQTKSDGDLDELKKALEVSRKEIRQLQLKLRSNDEKSKRCGNHDKMQMKLEKHIDRIDYLEEQLRSERERSSEFSREILDKEKKHAADLMSVGEELGENRICLKRSAEFLLKKWRHRLVRWPLMRDALDQLDNSDCDLQLMQHPLDKELELLKQEIKFVGGVMENLGKTGLLDESSDSSLITNSTNDMRFQNKYLLRPPTLVLKPLSPDSPNLEINTPKYGPPIGKAESTGMSPDSRADAIEMTTRIGAGDISEDTFASASASTSTRGFNQEDLNSIYEEADDDGILPFPIIKFDQVHDETEDTILSEEELAERFTTFVTEFTNERETIKERLDVHYERIRETELKLSTAVKGILNLAKAACPDSNTQQGDILMRNIVSSVCQLCHLAERFGAMKQERKRAASLTAMISHTTNLYLRLETTKKTSYEFTGPPTRSPRLLQSYCVNNDSIFPTTSPLISREVFCFNLMMFTVMCLAFCAFVVWSNRDDPLWMEILRGFVRKEHRNGPPPL